MSPIVVQHSLVCTFYMPTLKSKTNWMYLRHPITPRNSSNFSHIYNSLKRCNRCMNNARTICAFWLAEKRCPNHRKKKQTSNSFYSVCVINVINGAPYGIFHVATEEYWMECFGRSACVPTPQSIRCTHTHSNQTVFQNQINSTNLYVQLCYFYGYWMAPRVQQIV